jgi:AcrR family transcriptional regulator
VAHHPILAVLRYRWYRRAVNRSAAAAPRKAPTRSERKGRTRAELLEAAERLFRRDGFHATSVDAIADEAG